MDEKQAPQQGQAPGQVQIKADEKELQGMYSNLVMIQHHAEEFTLNFVYVFPNATQGKLLSQHDRQSRPRQTYLARPNRKHLAL